MEKHDFDILFLDVTSPRSYDAHTLERQPLGGTEATVIRVAEGLAGFGLRVAVVQSAGPRFDPTISKHAFYFHAEDLPQLTCKHFVQLRGVGNSHLYPKAKKYVWLHDTATDKMLDWNDTIHDKNITVIGVSQFHRKEIKKYVTTSNVEYIYNPVQDEIYKDPDLELTYDHTRFVWASSPHKGLKKALETFKRVRTALPDSQLVIANPGYLNLDKVELSSIPGVSVIGAMPCKSLWALLQQSLCLFYPSDFDETFGLVLAEANALGVPMLGYNRGVLKEVVSSQDQLVEDGNEDAIVERAVEWTNSRPKIEGNQEFRLSSVIFRWVQLLGK